MVSAPAAMGTACRTVDATHGLAVDEVRCVTVGPRGELWLGTRGAGVARVDGDTVVVLRPGSRGVPATAMDVWADTLGNVWFAGAGIQRWRAGAWTSWGIADGLPGRRFFRIVPGPDGEVLACGEGGVVRWTTASGWQVAFGAGDGLPHRTVYDVRVDAHGRWWFATPAGVGCYDGRKWRSYLEGQDVRTVCETRDGALWFGTARRGAVRFDGSNWRRFTPRRTLLPVAEDARGHLWCLTARAGLYVWDGSTWTRRSRAQGIASDIVFDLSLDPAGRIWVATAAGVSCVEPP